jgi:uncharacterized membrane protein YgdD (TMEM256/DUF423 family)
MSPTSSSKSFRESLECIKGAAMVGFHSIPFVLSTLSTVSCISEIQDPSSNTIPIINIDFFIFTLFSNKNRMNTSKTTIHLKAAAYICAAYVALGAFGAHSLKPLLSEAQLGTYETGLRYMIIHALGLLLINSLYLLLQKYNKWPSLFFYAGLILFSLSLLIHSLKDLIGIQMDVFAMAKNCLVVWLVYARGLVKIR